jgi:hypothetical protein
MDGKGTNSRRHDAARLLRRAVVSPWCSARRKAEERRAEQGAGERCAGARGPGGGSLGRWRGCSALGNYSPKARVRMPGWCGFHGRRTRWRRGLVRQRGGYPRVPAKQQGAGPGCGFCTWPHECAPAWTKPARRVAWPPCTRDARERNGPEVEGRGIAQDDGWALRVRERRERRRTVVWARSVGRLARPCAGLLRGRSGCGPVSGKRLRASSRL